MDHVPVMPRAAPAEQTSSPRGPAVARATVPPAGVEAEQVAAALMRRCPGALVWFGTRTRRWWAFVKVNGAWTLLETQTVEEIAQALMGSNGHGTSPGKGGKAGRF